MTSQNDSPEDDQSAITGLGNVVNEHTWRDLQTEPDQNAVWIMFAEISQGLQVSSASIKAAISSLLDTSIIWDRSAQHEFMQSIDQSIDHISTLMVVMTLAMKSQSGVLELVLEPSSVQEILFRVTDAIGKERTGVSIILSLPSQGKPALLDYDYLRIALKILLEALISADRIPPDVIHIRAEESLTDWRIEVEGGFTGAATELIAWLNASNQARPLPKGIKSEVMLKAFTAVRLLKQLNIKLLGPDVTAAPTSFTLVIPFTGERWTSAARS